MPTLKTEQARIASDIDAAKDRLGDLDANLAEHQEILELAATLATRCADAYRKASDRTRKQFNNAFLERLELKDGRISNQEYRPPFNDIFNVPEFEYETRVEVAGIEPASTNFGPRRKWLKMGSHQGFRPYHTRPSLTAGDPYFVSCAYQVCPGCVRRGPSATQSGGHCP